MELPDFHIPHAEKIEWMLETTGWAIEPVAAEPDTEPPTPAYAYTIGVHQLTGFPDLVVFGMRPSSAKGLFDLVIDALRGGTEIPVGVEVVGLFDNDLRCAFATVDTDELGALFTTAAAWYKGESFPMVQLLYPDRNGFMPYETGFDATLAPSQPVIGTFA
jgi:hypothetical protein